MVPLVKRRPAVDHISCIQSVKNSKKSQVIKLKRNGDNQLTDIQIYKELFSYINRLNGESALASIYILYDLQSGIFWWQYHEDSYDDYFKRKVDTHLNHVEYWEDENAVYNYHDEIRKSKSFNSQFYIFFSADKIAKFYVSTELYYRGSQGQYKTFEHAYEALISSIHKNGTFIEPWKGEVVLWEYLDRNFFCIPHRSQSPIITKLIEVKYFEGKWMVKIEGSDWRQNNPKKKAIVTVILNDNYELVEMIFGKDHLKKKSTD
jgi:hypothetical protein